jgi:hypothetical protein
MKAKTKDPTITNDASTIPDGDVPGNDTSAESSQDRSNDLSDDEMAAFKKIMGDIEGQENEKLNGTANSGNHEGPPIPPSTNTVDPRPGDDDDDGLDADQQKAFESIMAQIGGVGGTDPDAGSDEEIAAEPDPEPVDDFSAELEKVVKEAEAVETGEPRNAESEESEDALDGDQLKAFENIMAQIEGRQPEKAAPATQVSGASDVQKEEQAPRPAATATLEPDEETQDISDDIDDILKEIRSSDDETPLAGTVDADRVAETTHVDVINNTVAIPHGEDRKPEQDVDPQASPSSVNGLESSRSEARSSIKDLPVTPLADLTPASGEGQVPLTVKPLREATRPRSGVTKRVIMASVVAVGSLALAGYFHWTSANRSHPETPLPLTDTIRPEGVAATRPVPAPQGPPTADQGSSDQSRLKAAAENLDRLRNELLEKQAEIQELRAYYQAGIDAEIQGVMDTVRKAGRGNLNFSDAMADPRISLGLAAIQRRDNYIQKLATPANALFRSSEALLFYSRKAGLLALMAGRTSDIDVDGFIRQADEIRVVHGSVLTQLDIDGVPASSLELESIWQEIGKRLIATPVNAENDPGVGSTDNAAIWKNICQGDFNRKHALTVLSPEAARCLATWKGKDLFLNALTGLEADTARQLAAWDGDWLGLNGLKDLSPDAAMHLSRWKGKKLSLNGLTRLSPRVVAILSEWQGDQIELVNVQHMAHWENPKTRLFFSEDLKRKPIVIRK